MSKNCSKFSCSNSSKNRTKCIRIITTWIVMSLVAVVKNINNNSSSNNYNNNNNNNNNMCNISRISKIFISNSSSSRQKHTIFPWYNNSSKTKII